MSHTCTHAHARTHDHAHALMHECVRCAERDTHEWCPITSLTSLIQFHSLKVGQTANLIRIQIECVRCAERDTHEWSDYKPNTISFSESHWPAPSMTPPLQATRPRNSPPSEPVARMSIVAHTHTRTQARRHAGTHISIQLYTVTAHVGPIELELCQLYIYVRLLKTLV